MPGSEQLPCQSRTYSNSMIYKIMLKGYAHYWRVAPKEWLLVGACAEGEWRMAKGAFHRPRCRKSRLVGLRSRLAVLHYPHRGGTDRGVVELLVHGAQPRDAALRRELHRGIAAARAVGMADVGILRAPGL